MNWLNGLNWFPGCAWEPMSRGSASRASRGRASRICVTRHSLVTSKRAKIPLLLLQLSQQPSTYLRLVLSATAAQSFFQQSNS